MYQYQRGLSSQVNVLGPGVRDPVPATPDGGALQEALQHLRIPRRLHRGADGAADGRREAAGTAGADPLPRVGRGEGRTAVPLQDSGDGPVAVHSGLHLLAVCVSI